MLSVLPLLYNAVQCLIIHYRLLHSLPAAARKFFHLHPNPVGGTVTCSFRSPVFELHGLLDSVKRCHAPIDLQILPHVEPLGLGASLMRLIHALGFEPRRKREAQRILVNSSLDVDTVVINCNWKSFVFLAIGLGVNASDLVLHDLGSGADVINEHAVQSSALRSEAGMKLIDIRWQKGTPHLELTAQCSSWSIRRSLAHFLHMTVQREAKTQLLHFVAATDKTHQLPTVKSCDCKDIISNPVDLSVLHNLHFALTWTLYFEELLHQVQCETIFIPQSLLLFQFEITEELRQMPTETLRSRVTTTVFPGNAKAAANIMSALSSIWDSPEHQQLLDGLGSGAHRPGPRKSQKDPQPITSMPSPPQPLSKDASADVEKGNKIEDSTNSASPSEKFISKHMSEDNLKIYPTFQSSPVFQSLFFAYSPSAAIAAAHSRQSSSTPPVPVPTAPPIDIDDKSKPEALLAQLIIALSTMRHSKARNGWVTSIASGSLKYKVGTQSGDHMIGKLMKYEGRTISIE